jgi:hypothetical protein
MKNSVVTLLLALLVVLTAVSVRRMVAGNATYAGTPTLVAIGTDPVPPVPPGKPSGLMPTSAMKTMAIGTDPVPPVPPGKPSSKTLAIGTDPVPPVPPGKPSGPKEVGLMLLAIGTDPVPPVPPPAPKPAPQKPSN